MTIPIGLGIGRLVFRALNRAEAVLALAVIGAVLAGGAPLTVIVLTAVAAALLTLQITLIRPRLSRRTSQILAGANLSRSRTHLCYVAAEAAKVIALAALGIGLLTR